MSKIPTKQIVDPESPVVAFVANDNYAMPLAAAIASVIANLGKNQKIEIFIVDVGVSAVRKKIVDQLANPNGVKISWIVPPETYVDTVESLPQGYVERTCYYKMFIHELLGPGYPQILYLDCDLIVEADITELWRAEMGDHYLLAAQDLVNPFVSSPYGLRNWRELGRDGKDELFNTGVYVLNAAKWHEEGIGPKLVEYLKEHHQSVRLCDQDAINAVVNNQWGRLDRRWNVLPYMSLARRYSLLSKRQQQALIGEAKLLHFCGPNKPWNFRCKHPKRDRFFFYLDRTQWAGWRPDPFKINLSFVIYYLNRTLSRLKKVIPF